MPNCEDAASLLLLELGLAWLLPMDLVHAFFVSTLRVFLLLLFSGQQKTSCTAAAPGDPRCGGSCLGSMRSILTMILCE